MAGNRRSGRRRTPTAVKRALGSQIRHDVDQEPTAPTGVPRRPPHLDDDPEASAAWDTLAARLLVQRVLTTAHAELLAVLADAWAQYVRLKTAYRVDGYRSIIVQEWTDEKGHERSRVIENPLCRQVRQQALLLNTLLGEFGQTPASAPKVAAHAESPDPFDQFLQGPTPAPTVVPFRRRQKGAARA